MNKKHIKSLIPITRIVVVREGDIYVPGEYDLVKAKLQAAKKGDTPIHGYFELPVLSWMRKEKLKSGNFKFYKSYSSSNHMAWMLRIKPFKTARLLPSTNVHGRKVLRLIIPALLIIHLPKPY